MNPRESTLLRGLEDWVALDRIHWDVAQSMPDAPLPEVQSETLKLIHDLVDQRLCEIGDVTSESGFSAWTGSLAESTERIRQVYVAEFDDQNIWPWFCWLNLTDNGEQIAREIQSRSTR